MIYITCSEPAHERGTTNSSPTKGYTRSSACAILGTAGCRTSVMRSSSLLVTCSDGIRLDFVNGRFSQVVFSKG